MDVPEETAMGTLRFSTGRFLTEAEVDRAARLVATTVRRLRPSEESAPAATAEVDEVKLTRFTTGLGCACKLRPQALEKVLRAVPVRPDPRVLIGIETADDAAVYRISDDLALVQSVDFFTPVVDDPHGFGAVAAANALSDLYAMGATPLFALSVAAFPSDRLPLEALEAILRGASEVAARAGISIVGGHTIDDREPKFGLAVTGSVHPDRILSNRGAAPGDALVLTKPLGLGILTTALKRGMLDAEETATVQATMAELNATAAEVARGFPVSACTDVTGFGLLGHLREMAVASGVDVEVDVGRLPVLGRAPELATGGVVPGGTLNNLEHVAPGVDWGDGVSRTEQVIAADAQTSGGLLLSLPGDRADELVAALRAADVRDATRVGRVIGAGEGRIRVR
jgi:cysteine desulfurase